MSSLFGLRREEELLSWVQVREVDERSKTMYKRWKLMSAVMTGVGLGGIMSCLAGAQEVSSRRSVLQYLPPRKQMLMKLMRRLPLPIIHPTQFTKH